MEKSSELMQRRFFDASHVGMRRRIHSIRRNAHFQQQFSERNFQTSPLLLSLAILYWNCWQS